MHRMSIAALVATWGTACTVVNSSHVATDTMSPTFLALTDGGETVVGGFLSATLVDGGGAVVHLSVGDTLSASANGQTVSLEAIVDGGMDSWYQGVLDAAAPGTTFDIDFSRAFGVSAPHSITTLPSSFNLSLPQSQYSRAHDALIVTWDTASAPEETMTCFWDTSCLASSQCGPITADAGSLTIPAGTLMSEPADAGCPVTLVIWRGRSGTVDPAFASDGGAFFGIQQRTVSFTSTP